MDYDSVSYQKGHKKEKLWYSDDDTCIQEIYYFIKQLTSLKKTFIKTSLTIAKELHT